MELPGHTHRHRGGGRHPQTDPALPAADQRQGRTVHNRTLLEEWAYTRPYTCEAGRVAAFATFLHTYNHDRGHTALAGASPADRVPNLAGQNS